MSEYPSRPHEPYFTLKGELQLAVAADALEIQAPKQYKRQIQNYRILSKLNTDGNLPHYAEGVEGQRVRVGYETSGQTQLDILEGVRTILADPNVPTLRKVAAEALLDTIIGTSEEYADAEGTI